MFDRISFTHCLLCNERLTEVPTWKELVRYQFPPSKCKRCAKAFRLLNKEIEDVYCLFEYNEAMSDYFRRYKFMKDVYLAHFFREELHQYLSKFLKYNEKAIVTSIPIYEEHKKERTFSHVEELLYAANIPFQITLKKLSSQRQSQKTKEERLKTKNLFQIIGNVSDMNFIVFDDIKTTGVTLKLAEEALLKAGANKVKLVALAGRALVE